LTRTLSPLVGKTADYNFVESAKFLSQISQVCEHNPNGAQILASKLTKIQPQVRDEFARIALRIGSDAADASSLAIMQPANSSATRSPGTSSPATSSAGVGPDSGKLTANGARKQIPAPVNLDAAEELAQQLNPQRVPPMTLSDKTVIPESTANPIQFQARPQSIAPAKPNIYMRR